MYMYTCIGILITPIKENQMEKNMGHEMEAGIIWGGYRGYSLNS